MSISVAFNTSVLRGPRTGIGTYVRGLVGALSDIDGLNVQAFSGWSWQSQLPDAPVPGFATAGRWFKRLVPNAYSFKRQLEQWRFERQRPSFDLYHEPSLWPLRFAGPTVMTVHDLTHIHYPQTQPNDRLRAIEKHLAPALERVQKIFVDSQFVADELTVHYGIKANRLVVAPLGCSDLFHPRADAHLALSLADYGLAPRQYILGVGTLEPRKNLALALQAYAALPRTLKARYPLVLAGMAGWGQDSMAPFLSQAQAQGVRFLGYVTDERLAGLYAGARLLFFPSLYEGFGLPLLEAMQSGTPVLACQAAAMPEVAGLAGSYFQSGDVDGASQMLERLLDDQIYWDQMRAKGLVRAQAFSWRNCAQISATTYREVLGVAG